MTDYGKRGKPNPGFPPFPQSLEIAARFPHSQSPDDESPLKPQTPTPERRPYGGSLPLPPSGSFFNEKMLSFSNGVRVPLDGPVMLTYTSPRGIPGSLVVRRGFIASKGESHGPSRSGSILRVADVH